MSEVKSVVDKAEEYYDSVDADEFYFNIWGGEDLHIGIYQADRESIARASTRTVERIADKPTITPQSRVLDLGAGYGGSARYLAKRFGCHVTALNISETQNKRDREMNAAQGLAELVDVVHGNFEELPFEDGTFDLLWSQDSILHSGRRRLVLQEAFRVLKAGGEFTFTDPMQADDVSQGVLQPVYDRIHLESLGSFAWYEKTAKEIGFEVVELDRLSEHLPRHYTRVRQELQGRYDEITGLASRAYVDRMLAGLQHWIDAGQAGHLAWGILHLRKPA